MTRNAAKKPAAESCLAPEEYDFSSVPKDELTACLIYEYARESRAVRKVIAAERKQRVTRKGESEAVKSGTRVRNQFQSQLLMLLSLSSGFPNAPWQKLSDKEKQIILKFVAVRPALAFILATSQRPPLCFDTKACGTMTLDNWKHQYCDWFKGVLDRDRVVFGFFAVNLNYGHPILMHEFKGKLRHFEGKPLLEWPPPIAKQEAMPPGRRSAHDALNALGAMRLRYHCKGFVPAKKMMLPLRDKPNGMFFTHRESFNRACRAALRHFQQRFGWLDSSKPIHFPQPEQK